MAKFEGEDRFKKRYVRDYRFFVDEVPIWAVIPLVETLRAKAKELDLELLEPTARIEFTTTTQSVSAEKDPEHDALSAFMDKLYLAFDSDLKETQEYRPIAEAQAEHEAKRRQ